MAEQPLHSDHIGALFEQPRRIGVAELVQRGAFDPCPLRRLLQPPQQMRLPAATACGETHRRLSGRPAQLRRSTGGSGTSRCS